jgi:endogenous inhibitor of DNA gyrase (YacG/DUF329 family)
MPVIVQCANCNKDVAKEPGQVQRNTTGRFFCSAKCRNATGVKPRKGTYRQCSVCGTDFYARPSSDAKYCSNKCVNIRNTTVGTEERMCQGCGKAFAFRLTMAKYNAGVFCSKQCGYDYRKAQSAGRTKITGDGYVVVRIPDHPSAQANGWIMEHRMLMEEQLGRQLLPHESVHHKNTVRDDNRLENLELWCGPTRGAQPYGGRVSDITAFAVEHLKLYAPELLK